MYPPVSEIPSADVCRMLSIRHHLLPYFRYGVLLVDFQNVRVCFSHVDGFRHSDFCAQHHHSVKACYSVVGNMDGHLGFPSQRNPRVSSARAAEDHGVDPHLRPPLLEGLDEEGLGLANVSAPEARPGGQPGPEPVDEVDASRGLRVGGETPVECGDAPREEAHAHPIPWHHHDGGKDSRLRLFGLWLRRHSHAVDAVALVDLRVELLDQVGHPVLREQGRLRRLEPRLRTRGEGRVAPRRARHADHGVSGQRAAGHEG
eukprot:CAMPEP_0114527846 /NCGR_PEP_ID=MMETSP0109-20121206/23857_1 /TAXON_ID=29199 /ORGANISM="Chlorarachnion reptans, Strain CCCM449" /LENGTH=258 /DNA_ID=CAMNT_0001709885 /DNA_START=750 /DNA_END=1526 /DNA_ORIENTATION=-